MESNQNNANQSGTNTPQSGPIDLEKVKQFAGMIQQWCADPKRREDLLNRLGEAKGLVWPQVFFPRPKAFGTS